MGDSKTPQVKFFTQIIPGILKAGVPALMCLSIAMLVLYGSGSRLSDEALITLLRILCFSASGLAILSFCALGYSIRLLARKHQTRYILHIIAYFISGLSGLVMVVVGCFVLVIAG